MVLGLGTVLDENIFEVHSKLVELYHLSFNHSQDQQNEKEMINDEI